ncbi:MAG TPA: SDR family NAD(P)-dependent oxidoreductase [Candidatus Chromulinivoraceae bacterium]|nr:SDR family NAD(P)-dependent oxidoreductase [Candidatus Chromulinivoraceae bacterium]
MTKEPYQKIDNHKFGSWAVVTGASSGIGEQFARQLAASNINLVLVARRLPVLNKLGDSLTKEYGVSYRAVRVDLTDENFLSDIVKATKDIEVGLVVSNAGVGATREFLTADLPTLLESVRVNVSAHVQLAHHFGKLMSKRGRGGILLVSSLMGLQGVPYMADYGAAKAYILSLAEALHAELKPSGVNVAALLPGPVATPMLTELGLASQDSSMKPMSAEQCAAEGLKAITSNTAVRIPGVANRVISKLPRSVVTGILGKMNAKVLASRNAKTSKD